MKFSIVIPTWEQYGKGIFFLNQLLSSIRNQNYKNLEIIISDHSINDDIKKLTNNFLDLPIKYFRNENNRGNSPANLNFGLRHANGEIIKIMFQDDFFVNNNSLNLIENAFLNKNTKWLVNGCCHTTDSVNFYNFMIPSWNDKILEGVNTISSPSVLSFINDKISFFDENLTMLMDCDYYYILYKKYGLPYILPDYLIANTSHQNQISKMYTKNLQEEINIVKNKNYELRE
jgi:glycosyltransferase involved in cell wall biosynthesis